MLRSGVLTLNLLLVAAGVYLAATGVRTLLLSAPTPAVHLPEPAPAPPTQVSFERYRKVATRSLFRAGPPSAEPEVPAEDQELEESELRYRLIGTAAASAPDLSLAILQDQNTRQTVLVRPGFELSEARVVRIERRRVVVENRGRLEEIRFDEDKEGAAGATRGRPTASREAPAASPRAMVPANRRASSPERSSAYAERLKALREQAAASRPQAAARAQSLLTQARIVPRYAEEGQRSGLEINSIRSGSLLEQAGFENGDLVVAINGEDLSDLGHGLRTFRDLSSSEQFAVDVEREGAIVTLRYAAPPE